MEDASQSSIQKSECNSSNVNTEEDSSSEVTPIQSDSCTNGPGPSRTADILPPDISLTPNENSYIIPSDACDFDQRNTLLNGSKTTCLCPKDDGKTPCNFRMSGNRNSSREDPLFHSNSIRSLRTGKTKSHVVFGANRYVGGTTSSIDIETPIASDSTIVPSVMYGLESSSGIFFIDITKSNARAFSTTLHSEVYENRNVNIESPESTGSTVTETPPLYESLNVCNLPEHSIAVRDTMPPTYKSLRSLILEDEPPKYETVTGKSLASELKYDVETTTTATIEEPSQVMGVPPRITCEQKAICSALMFGIGIIIFAFGAAAFRLM